MVSTLKSIAEQLEYVKSEKGQVYKNQSAIRKQSKLSTKVFEYIVDSILNGIYPPSSRISPKKIASQLGISLAPVRDAMEQLEQDGWITRIPQKGTYVRHISLEDIEQIYELRQILETGSIRIALENVTTGFLVSLKATVDLLIQAARSGDLQAYEKLDTQFHIQLVESTDNKALISTFLSILLKTRCYFVALKATSYGQQSVNDLEEAAISHKHIYEAIATKQKEKAEQLLQQHIAVSCEWNKARIRIQQLSEI